MFYCVYIQFLKHIKEYKKYKKNINVTNILYNYIIIVYYTKA